MKARPCTIAALAALLTMLPARSQPATSQASPPAFEVASIRPSKNPEPGGDTQITPGRFRGKDLALQWLILTAYRLGSDRLSGNLPNWTIADRWDIDARMPQAASEGDVLIALQALLKDRFKLEVHSEKREQAVYYMTVGKEGVKMPAGSCVPLKQDLPNECYTLTSSGLIQTLDWRGVRLSDPAGVSYRTLSGHLSIDRHPIIDRTGLTGTFDVHLRWARDPEPAPAGTTGNPSPAVVADAPSLVDAMEQQLGLKLQPGRGPVEYLIVDHVERPAGD